ncbi:Yippee zinc-binding/DNA-binding/Mis18 [Phytophthora infestans]|uniref:Yippee zinc-binding/DNA-binding /Mis18 n=1 Tax=Phytophthora infestans TaxID=4787 RepID=A0A833SZG4_PHYIN|nr:Yippee zinc-binding/DNA-binding/Mis18 [Phytophthora infestans]KAF4127387.1 Yippee zinc-binding/DNA-binding /Mis18 [Phytophthora infestans]KAF4130523.1 Yippee zinc-binding/DNA-binding /Mis18 [Phytophthora infestans]
MPPLVVIRSGCKHVEYLENRSEEEDEELLRQAEEAWRGSDTNCSVSKVFGFSREMCDVEGMHAFRCADCGNVVADRDDVVSKTFFGRTGKAFLMNNMYNICVGPARNRYLMTGMHSIADVLCSQCDFVLGWKYIKAMESSQKYKEGKFIMEQAVVEDDSEEHAWNRL